MANFASNSVTVIDTVTLEVIKTIAVSQFPVAMAVIENHIFLTTRSGVDVIDTTTDTLVANFLEGTDLYGISVNPDKTKLFIANRDIGGVTVVNAADYTTETTISTGSGTHAVEVSPDGTLAYAVNSYSGTLSVIDTSSYTVSNTIPVGSFPYVVGISSDGKSVYTINYGSNDMSVIDTETNTVINTISLSPGPFMVGTFMVPTAVAISNPEPTLSSNADLANITISDGTWDQPFDKDLTEYHVTVGNEISSITLSTEVEDETATVTINGMQVENSQSSQPIELTVGSDNVILISVTAEDGTIKTYTILVTRTASSNTNLSNITLNNGTLDPAFHPEITSYTVQVGNEVDSITLSAEVEDETATIQINGKSILAGEESDAITLQAGSTTEITITVTAEDNTTKVYTILVTRAASEVIDDGDEENEIPVTDDEDGNNNSDPSNDDKDVSDNGNDTGSQVGKELPNTSTSNYQLLVVGLLFIIFGSFILFITRKQKRVV